MQAGESGSIQHQKMILQRYADEHHFLNTKFFVDDGFSGVSFEREGLQAMLQEVEAGRVATVITKDLSRLGRNYLKTGELIEIVFPENGVRYIAINDGVDTAREDNEFTPLRNWFNEFYARDTSKKIRAVKQAQAQKGERVNGEYPYGYIPDPNKWRTQTVLRTTEILCKRQIPSYFKYDHSTITRKQMACVIIMNTIQRLESQMPSLLRRCLVNFLLCSSNNSFSALMWSAVH